MEWKEFDGNNFPPLGTWCVCLDYNGNMVVRQVERIVQDNIYENQFYIALKDGPGVRLSFVRNKRGRFFDPARNVAYFMEIPDPPKAKAGDSRRVVLLKQKIEELENKIRELEQGDE